MNTFNSTLSMKRQRPLAKVVSLIVVLATSLALITTVLMVPGLSGTVGAAPPRYAVGPDDFGYRLKDSNEADGPTYLWEDISNTGAQITSWSSTDDGYAGPVPIGFDFEYYGTTYDHLFVGSNGYVSFGQGHGYIPGGTLPSTSWPNNDIALFGGDMYLNNVGFDSRVYYQTLTSPDRFVLQLEDLYFCCGQNTPHTLQLILYPSGDILVQYSELNGDTTSYVGIENADGTDGLGYGSSLANGLAIQYYYPTGVSFQPSVAVGYDEPGTTVNYAASLLNHTRVSDSFTLTLLSGNAWTATLSLTQTDTLSNGESIDFELSVEIPSDAAPGESDTVTIEATSHSNPDLYTDVAAFTTIAAGGDLAYVTVSNHDYLALVDPVAGIVVDTIDLQPAGCDFPWRAAMPPDGQTVWVSCRNSNKVLVLTRGNNEIVDVVDRHSPADIAFTQDGDYALVGTRSGSDVMVIDTASFTTEANVATDSYPVAIVMHPYLPVAYAVHRLYDNSTVSVIDTTSWAVVDSIDVGNSPRFATISRDGLRLYVANTGGYSVSVVDTTINSQIATIELGAQPRDLAVTPDGQTLYVTRDWGDSIAVIDTSSNTVQGTVAVDPTGHFNQPWGVGLTCDGQRLIVSNAHDHTDLNSHQVAIVETATLSATQIVMPDNNQDNYPDAGARGLVACPQFVPTGAFLVPGEQTNSGARGADVAHTLKLYNFSRITDSYTVSLGNHNWSSTLSAEMVGPLEHGASAEISATVTVPSAAAWYATDSVVVTASSIASPTLFTDLATLTTEAFAPPSITISPDYFSSSQPVGEIVHETLTIGNGNGVDLHFELDTGSIDATPLENVLENLNQNFQTVIDAIPNSYEFDEGISGSQIGDGGGDMYDGGNMLSTDLGGIIEYSDDTIVESAVFGSNGQYFTRKYPGLFVLVADVSGVDHFEINGNLGADGGGSADGAILQSNLFGVTYQGFVKRVYDAGDPSVNHLIIVADNPAADHTYTTDTNNDQHRVFNLASNRRLYYLLYAGNNGFYIDDNAALNIMETFLEALGISSPAPWLLTDPISGTVSTNNSQPVDVIFDAHGMQPGEHTAHLTVTSNDPAVPHLALPVTMTVAPTADMGQVYGSATDAWTGDPLTATVELMGVYTMLAEPDYAIWAPAGTYTLVASASGYASETLSIDISAGDQTIQDIALEPAQARMEHILAPIRVYASPGKTGSTTLTMANSGPTMLEVTFHEMAAREQLLAEMPLDLGNRKILYDRAHGGPSSSDYSTLISDLTIAGATITENFVFPIDASVLDDYDVLWVNCCGYTNWTFTELTVLADWLAAGGAILVHGSSSASTSGPASIYGINYQNGCSYGATDNIADHYITVGVNEVSVDTCNFLTFGPGTSVAVFDNANQPHVVVHEQDGGKMIVVAGIDFDNYRISQADNRLLANNILGWLAEPGYRDIPWLSVSPANIAIAGHDTGEITIHGDASGLNQGTYKAVLAIEHNDPNQRSPVEILVILEVQNWKVYVPFVVAGVD